MTYLKETPSLRESLANVQTSPQDVPELRTRIETLIDIEQRSASISPITPLYVSRMLHVPLDEVEACMKEMNL